MGCYLRNLGSTRPPGVLLSATIPWICKSELLNPLYRRYISALFYVGLLLPFHFCWSHLHYVGDLTIFCPHFLLLFILPVLLLQYIYIYIYIYEQGPPHPPPPSQMVPPPVAGEGGFSQQPSHGVCSLYSAYNAYVSIIRMDILYVI